MKTVLSLRSVQHTSNENKMFVAQKIAAYRRSDQETNDLRYPKYVSLRCCSIQPNLRLAPAIVCACCSVGAPAELLLLFLPPRPRADSLSKQALSLPSRWGDSFPNGCRVHDYYFLFFIYSVECLQMLELDLKKVKNHTRVTGGLVCQAAACSSFSVSYTSRSERDDWKLAEQHASWRPV